MFGFERSGPRGAGQLADLNVIDADNVASEAPEMVYDLPAGGRRLVQRARGYVATIKRGVVVRDHDAATGERPGRLVRGPQPGSRRPELMGSVPRSLRHGFRVRYLTSGLAD